MLTNRAAEILTIGYGRRAFCGRDLFLLEGVLPVYRLKVLASGVALMAAAFLPSAAIAASNQPTVAVYGFNSQGLNPWWGSNFDPGAALADILTDRLVNVGQYSVVDRSHIQQVLGEQNLSQAGDVTPVTQAKLGRMLGAGYLVVGRIIQFDKTGNRGGGLGSMLGGLGGVSSNKTVLRVSVKILEVNTGRIVEAIDDEQSTTSTSFAIAGFGAGSGAAYESQDFQSSAMGRLLTSVADDLIKKIDPTKLVASAPAPVINGRIIGVDAGSVILNVGSSKGVQEGMTFQSFDIKELRDPDSGKTIRSEIPRGSLQIISVSPDSSVGKRISGSVKARQGVRSEP